MADREQIEAFLETVCDRSDNGVLELGESIRGPQDASSGRALELLGKLSDGAGNFAGLSIKETIGQGGVGVVRLAQQHSLGRSVAVKGVRPDRASNEAAASILREAWATGVLEHPNVVPIYDLGKDENGQPVVIMKRIVGVEWSELMFNRDVVERRFDAHDLLEWNLSVLLAVMNALRYAHSRGIVHRDIKPSNVMIGEFGEVYLVDWGLAVAVHERFADRLPRAGRDTQPIGTPGYMAPEMLRGEPVDERTDIYLVGAVLYEAVTGRMPHFAADIEGVVASIQSSPPPLPATVPPGLAAICQRAMAAARADRFQSIDSMQRAIHEFLTHRSAAALIARGDERLARLDEEVSRLAERPRSELEDQVRALYPLLAECRFAYRTALAEWPKSEDAVSRLREANTLMVEAELQAGDPRAADRVLDEMDEPPAELQERVARAKSAELARLRQLETLDRMHDRSTGWRTRLAVVVPLTLLWVLIPLAIDLFTPTALSSFRSMAVVALVVLAIVLGLAFWARESLFKTAFNRQVTLTLMFIPVSLLVLIGGGSMLGLPPQSHVLSLFLWFVIATISSFAFGRGILAMPLAYLAAFFVAAWRPEWMLRATAVANAVALGNFLYFSFRLAENPGAAKSES